jgi:hypothetical protein
MDELARDAVRVRDAIERNLSDEIEIGCQRALAHARLERAIPGVVQAIDHPALTVDRRETPHGHTQTVRLLGRVLVRWCFSPEHVDVYCRIDRGSPIHVRFTFASIETVWRISLPGRRPTCDVFTDEEAKVFEVVEDAMQDGARLCV